MTDFPSEAYTAAQHKWLGRDHLITPTIRRAFGDVLNGKRVLDVGCGNGHYTYDFLHWGAQRVVGIDNSEEMIRICEESSEFQENSEKLKIAFSLQDVKHFRLETEHFDVVTAFFVLQFLHEKDDVRKAIQNVSRHLKSDGIFFALLPNGVKGIRPPENMGLKLGAQIIKAPGTEFLDGEIVEINFYSEAEVCGSAKIALHSREFYEKCLEEAGFSKIEWIAPHFTQHAVDVLGDEFCEQYLNPPCDILLKCVKL